MKWRPPGDWRQQFIHRPFVQRLIGWSKRHSLPGFKGVPLYDVFMFVYGELQRQTLVIRANAVAFSFFLSLFPALIALFSLAAQIPLYERFETELMLYIDSVVPTEAGRQLKEIIKDITRSNTQALSLGVVLALYFASNGMMTMMHSFEKSHLKSYKKRSPWRKRLIAIGLTLQMGLLLVASVGLIILGNLLIDWAADFFNLSQQTGLLLKSFRWLVILLLFYLGIAIIYRYGPSLRRKLQLVTPGTTLATLLSILSSLLFSLYIDKFDTYNRLYGSIGAIIVLMLWIQINAFILLIGYELNASIAVNRDLTRHLPPEEDE